MTHRSFLRFIRHVERAGVRLGKTSEPTSPACAQGLRQAATNARVADSLRNVTGKPGIATE
jgi:hypothetical protein